MAPRVLFVLTSADKTLLGQRTGWYLPEAAHPYYTLAPHAEIDFASPKGPNPPVDENSVKQYKDDESVRFLNDETVKTKLANTKELSKVNAVDYDAIFYVGGHGPVIDLASDPLNAQLASDFFRAGKITAAVCHGPAALVAATDANGKSIFYGRQATSFSDDEENALNMVQAIPFLVEDKIKELGGIFVKADKPWDPKVAVSDNLYTGQNPASAKPLAEEILKGLIKKA